MADILFHNLLGPAGISEWNRSLEFRLLTNRGRIGKRRRVSQRRGAACRAYSPISKAGREKTKRELEVLKFGGTSLNDAGCILRIADIIQDASRRTSLVVVVSAMGGVTDRLIESGRRAAEGDRIAVERILEELTIRHCAAVAELIGSEEARGRLTCTIKAVLDEASRLLQRAMALREVGPQEHDRIASIGERLCAPLVAAVLVERGTESEAIDATELIVTDSHYGAAEPRMDLTRRRTRARLRPVLKRGAVPVVTGFIGSTQDGALTTLGRGGSDYSATILGASLGAQEVVIWTDVDGLMTADPRLVAEAGTVAELSYGEASSLARFGAKVLHPKTLRAIEQVGIPLSICNTFAPERRGTKISATRLARAGNTKALAAVRDGGLITIGAPEIAIRTEFLPRAMAATAKVRATVLLAWQPLAQDNLCLVAPLPDGERVAEALRAEFVQELSTGEIKHVSLDSSVAIVSVVGLMGRGVSRIAGRISEALARQGVTGVAGVESASDGVVSFVMQRHEMHKALVAIHRELRLSAHAAETGARRNWRNAASSRLEAHEAAV